MAQLPRVRMYRRDDLNRFTSARDMRTPEPPRPKESMRHKQAVRAVNLGKMDHPNGVPRTQKGQYLARDAAVTVRNVASDKEGAGTFVQFNAYRWPLLARVGDIDHRILGL